MADSPDTSVAEQETQAAYPIRAMSNTDINEVLRVERASYRLPWTEQIFRDCLKVGYHCLVVEEANRLSGYVIFSCAVGEAHILNLCVDPAHRRSGFAEALLAQAVAVVIIAGAKIMFLEVRESNKGAIALYEKCGFVETGRRENYYNCIPEDGSKKTTRREDALVMARDLTL